MHVNVSRTLLSAAFWTCCYYFVKWCCRSDAEKADRLVAFVHSLVDSVLCITSFYVGPQMFQNYGEATTYLQEIAFATATGFYMFDICWQLKYKPKDTAMIAHHLLSLVAASYGFVIRKHGSESLLILFLLEVSHPFLQVRWLLNELNRRKTILNAVNECLFWSIFVSSRIVGYSYFVYTVLTYNEPNVVHIMIVVGFYMISTVLSMQYLFTKILKTSTVKWIQNWLSANNSTYDLNLVQKSLRKNSVQLDHKWPKLAA